MRRQRNPRRPCRTEPQRGSALLMVLLVMLLLLTMALPLLFVTKLEMLLGGTQRVITNNFYAAESGVHAAFGAALVTQDWGGEKFALIEGSMGKYMLGHRVVTTRIQGMGPPQPPPLTIANEGENDYHSFSVVLTSVAERVSWPDADPAHPTPPIYEDGDPRESQVTVQAQSVQTVHYFLSPIKTPASAGAIYSDEGTNTISW